MIARQRCKGRVQVHSVMSIGGCGRGNSRSKEMVKSRRPCWHHQAAKQMVKPPSLARTPHFCFHWQACIYEKHRRRRLRRTGGFSGGPLTSILERDFQREGLSSRAKDEGSACFLIHTVQGRSFITTWTNSFWHTVSSEAARFVRTSNASSEFH